MGSNISPKDTEEIAASLLKSIVYIREQINKFIDSFKYGDKNE